MRFRSTVRAPDGPRICPTHSRDLEIGRRDPGGAPTAVLCPGHDAAGCASSCGRNSRYRRYRFCSDANPSGPGPSNTRLPPFRHLALASWQQPVGCGTCDRMRYREFLDGRWARGISSPGEEVVDAPVRWTAPLSADPKRRRLRPPLPGPYTAIDTASSKCRAAPVTAGACRTRAGGPCASPGCGRRAESWTAGAR